MNKFIVALIAITGSVAFANNSKLLEKNCYSVTNPQNISISVDDTTTVETALQADVTVQTEAEYGTQQLIFNAQSKNLAFSTMAIRSSNEDMIRFGVECDGGSLSLIRSGNSFTAQSERLRGEVKATPEGCSSAAIAFKDLKLEEVACK